MPKITIITSCFNDLQALRRTIDSVASQQFDLEHFVVDGGSSDGTRRFLESVAQTNDSLRFISESDGGVYDAINKGVTLAQGEFLLVLNAGDTFYSESALMDIFELGLGSNADYIVGRVKYVYRDGSQKDDSQYFSCRENLECSHQAFIYKRVIHEQIGLYSLRYKSASDYEFFSRVYRAVGVAQEVKMPVFISLREKFGGDMSDSLRHTFEMIRIDFEYGFLKATFFRRFKELLLKFAKQFLIK